MASVVTDIGHMKRALAWFNQDDIYFGIGRSTKWEDEVNPPVPNVTDTLDTPICYKKVEQKCFVTPDSSGTIFYRGVMYRTLSLEEAYKIRSRFVFCASWLNYDEAPVSVEYRQFALITGLVRKSGVSEDKYILLPSEVEKADDVEVLVNDTVTMRSASKRERIAVIVEF